MKTSAMAFIFSLNLFAQSFVNLFDSTDVVFYGEQHATHEQHDSLMQTLEEGLVSGKINTFATEYVLVDLDEEFQEYLTHPDAIEGSEIENAFFRKIDESGLFWPSSPRNREFFRKLRELKLKHGDDFKVCGADFQIPMEVEDDVETIRSTYQNLPKNLLEKLLETSGMNLDELVEVDYYREANMALATHECFGEGGKGIVHMGAFHTHSQRSPMEDWWTASRLFHFLSGKDFLTFYNLIIYASNSEEPALVEALQELSIRCAFEEPVILAADAFPENLSQVLSALTREQGMENFRFQDYWDYFIFGPLGMRIEENDKPYMKE